LKDQDLINTRFIPDFLSVDGGKILITTGKYRYKFPEDVKTTIVGFINNPAIPFYILSDDNSWLSIGIIPPEYDKDDNFKHDNDFVNKISVTNKDYIKKMTFNVNKQLFLNSNTKVWRYFNFGPLVCKTCGIEFPQRAFTIPKSWKNSILNKNEKMVLSNLIEHPELSDLKRSKLVDLSHPTVSKIRKKLIKKGIVKKIITPNFLKLNFTILSWFNVELGEREIDTKILFPLSIYYNNILAFQDSRNIFLLSLYNDMKDLMTGQQKIHDFITKNMISYEDINFNYYSLENLNFDIKYNLETPTNIITELHRNEQDGQIENDPEVIFEQLLKPYLSNFEISTIIQRLKKTVCNYNSNDSNKQIPKNQVMNMVLELLTESSYLSNIEGYKRNALQLKLIEKLNSLKANFDTINRPEFIKNNKNVLIVEDSRTLVNIYEDILTSANFNVLGSVDNGFEAFNFYKKLYENNRQPDIILMDIFLRGSDGIETTKMIKDIDPNASIVVLTSSLDSKIKAKITQFGVDDYLIKPVTKAQLVNSLELVLIKNKKVIP
jgi:CheY-like chemotaxis protein